MCNKINNKYNLSISGNRDNLTAFHHKLVKLGYSTDSYTITDRLYISTYYNGKFWIQNTIPGKSDYTFNIDNKWEYEAALAIAAIRDDNKPYVGEWVVSNKDYYTLKERALWKISEVIQRNPISFHVEEYKCDNKNGTSDLRYHPKATPEEIIAYMKEKYSKIELPAKWCISAEELIFKKDFEEWFFKNIKNNADQPKFWAKTGYYFSKCYNNYTKERPHIWWSEILEGYTLITYETWKKWYDQQKEINMCNKKIIGYKLIKEYPGSPKLNKEITGHYFGEKCSDYPDFWQPLYEQEKKEEVLIIGSENVKVTIKQGDVKIYFESESLNIANIKRWLETFKGIRRIDTVEHHELYINLNYDHFVKSTRIIKYGCTWLSLTEIENIIKVYDRLNG